MSSSDFDDFLRNMAGAPARKDLVQEVSRGGHGLPGPGALLGERYRLMERLGSGGFAEVHEALHIPTGARVAIKILHRKGARATQARERFEREWRTLATLNHPNIVRLLDVDVDPDAGRFFVMELVHGERFDPAEVSLRGLLTSFGQLLEALSHAHAFGVVHRDLKPDNVLVSHSGADRRVQVLDFGIMHHDGSVSTMAEEARWATYEGRPMGTMLYMSPEQARGDNASVGPASDLYSAGVMLYEALTGRLPFDLDLEGSWLQVARRLTESPLLPFVALPAFSSSQDEALGELLMALLARPYAQRPESATDAGRALAGVLAALGPDEGHSLHPGPRPLAGPPTGVLVAGVSGARSPLGAQGLDPSGATEAPRQRPLPFLLSPGALRLPFHQEADPAGRLAVREQLLAWATRPNPGPKLLFLEGEEGLGKSYLARWLGRTLYRRGDSRVLRLGLQSGLQVGLQALLLAHLRHPPTAHRTLLQARLDEVLGLGSEDTAALMSFLTQAPASFSAGPCDLSFSYPCLAYITQRPNPRPLFLRMDGCDAAARVATAAWVHELFFHPCTRALPLRLLWTLDPLKPGSSPGGPDFVRLLARDRRATSLRLAPLPDQDLEALCTTFIPALSPNARAQAVLASQGSPQRLRKLLNRWIDSDALLEGPSGLSLRPHHHRLSPSDAAPRSR